MAFDIKSIFSGKGAAPAASQGSNSAPSATNNGTNAGTGNEGSTGVGDTGQVKDPGPLDAFKFLVDTKAEDGSDQASNKDFSFNKTSEVLTPEALSALSKKLDFSSAISEESLSALKEGKPDALIGVMNDIGRAAYTAALQHSGSLSDSVLENRFKSLTKSLPTNIGEVLTEHGLKESIPGFDNPIVKEGMKGIADRIRLAHPDATPKEVAKMTQDYFTALATVINPETGDKASSKNSPVDINWIEYALSEGSDKE